MSWQAKELGINLNDLLGERDQDWLGVAPAANSYYVSTQTIYRYVKAGKLAYKREKGRLWVSSIDLDSCFRHAGAN